MSQDKKFIIVQSESVANQLIAHGFCLLTNIGGTYTFLNETKENFKFSSLPNDKVCFTNILHI